MAPVLPLASSSNTFAAICTHVAGRVGLTIGSTIIGSSGSSEIELTAIAHAVLDEMFEAYAWPQCFKGHSFATVNGTASYALPPDFSDYHYDTFFNSSNGFRILGSITQQELAEIDGSAVVNSTYDRFQIKGVTDTQIFLSPTPSSAETVIFKYLSNRTVKPITWTTGTVYNAGAYSFYNGNYYTSSGGTAGASPPVHTSGTVSDGGINWTYYSGPYTRFLADTDQPLLSQRVLQLGMIEEYSIPHGRSFSDKYQEALKEAYRRAVPGKTIDVTGGSRGRFSFARGGRVSFGGY